MAKRSRKIVKPTLSKNQNGFRLWSCHGIPSPSYGIAQNRCHGVRCPKCFFESPDSGKDVSSGLSVTNAPGLLQVYVTNAPTCLKVFVPNAPTFFKVFVPNAPTFFRSMSPMLQPSLGLVYVPNAPTNLLTKGTVLCHVLRKTHRNILLQLFHGV